MLEIIQIVILVIMTIVVGAVCRAVLLDIDMRPDLRDIMVRIGEIQKRLDSTEMSIKGEALNREVALKELSRTISGWNKRIEIANELSSIDTVNQYSAEPMDPRVLVYKLGSGHWYESITLTDAEIRYNRLVAESVSSRNKKRTGVKK